MRDHITRRETLSAAGASGIVALAGCIGGDDTGSDDTNGEANGTGTRSDGDNLIRIGTLQDISGENGPEFAHQGLAGLLSGLAYKNGQDRPVSIPDTEQELRSINEPITYTVSDVGTMGDVEFEILVRDTESDPQLSFNVAQDLVFEEDVDVLYGVSSSDAVERINNLILDETDVPLFVGQASTTSITSNGDLCRDQLFRATENTAMNARAGAIYVSEQTDIERVAMISVPTTFGRDVIENYKQIFEQEDIDIVFEQEVEVALADIDQWQEYLDEAENSGAQAIIYGFTGITGQFYVDAFVDGNYDMVSYGQAGSRLTVREIGNAVLSFLEEIGIHEITPEILDFLPFGPVTCRYFWNQYNNDINDWLIDVHTDVYDVYPDLFTSSSFTTASAMVQAFDQADDVSQEAIIEQVSGMTVEATPKGEEQYHFQAYNNQARSPITLARYQPTTEEDSEFWPAALQPSEALTSISMNQTTIEQDNPVMTCDLS